MSVHSFSLNGARIPFFADVAAFFPGESGGASGCCSSEFRRGWFWWTSSRLRRKRDAYCCEVLLAVFLSRLRGNSCWLLCQAGGNDLSITAAVVTTCNILLRRRRVENEVCFKLFCCFRHRRSRSDSSHGSEGRFTRNVPWLRSHKGKSIRYHTKQRKTYQGRLVRRRGQQDMNEAATFYCRATTTAVMRKSIRDILLSIHPNNLVFRTRCKLPRWTQTQLPS